jgi:membrane protein
MIATIAARAGVDALIRGLNAAYGVRAHSTIFGFVLAYGLTLVIVGISLAGLATIVIIPIFLNFFVIAPVRSLMVTALPWAGMFLLVILTIGVLYRYGPNVKTPRTPIFTWGALLAALLWAAGSIAFSAYLGSFNSYNRIYGSIGTVVALLMWLYLGGFSVLLGALINVELARRRRLRRAREARKGFVEQVAEKPL